MPKRGKMGKAKSLTTNNLRPASPIIKGSKGRAKLNRSTRKNHRLK